MRVHRVGGLLVLVLALCAQRAWAFVDLDPPYITPAYPTGGELVSVNVRGSECDLIDDGVVWPPPITQQDSTITILFTGIHEEDPEFCYFSSDTRTYPVGVYAAGSYTLRVERRYGTFSGWVTETLGIVPFVVSGPTAPAIETPTLDATGLAALVLILIAATWSAGRDVWSGRRSASAEPPPKSIVRGEADLGPSPARGRRVGCLLVLVLALCTQRASAFLDPPYITPENPSAGEAVLVNIYGGECDVADDGLVWPPPVTQDGNAVTITLTGIHETDPEWCYFGIGTASYAVGRYPPGSYTLDVERRYVSFSGSWVQETLGVIPFTVSGAPPQRPIEATTMSMAGLVGLSSGLLAIAFFVHCRKFRSM